MTNCHNDQKFDSARLANALVGKWKWDHTLNCSVVVGGGKNITNYVGLTIEFQADGTFVINRPNSTSYFEWQLDSIPWYGRRVVDPNRAGAPPVETLWGTLRLCGDTLLSYSSYRDGLDDFYIRE
jgi:hypothetical protein